MDFDALWEIELHESIQEFVGTELDFFSVSSFARQLGIEIDHPFHEPMPAPRLVLVHGNQDYLATTDEISWIDDVTFVISCVDVLGHIVFAFDLDCDEEDYYLRCAAIIKIFNVAFRGNHFFIFRVKNAIALGSKRMAADIRDNFCVSMLLDPEKVTQNMLGMISELILSDLEDFGDIIDEYRLMVVYEEVEDVPVSLESIDGTEDLDLAFQRIYGFDFQNDEERAEQFRKELGADVRNLYAEARKELRYVGEKSTDSSYDVLEQARMAQENAEKVQWGREDDSGVTVEYVIDGRFSRAAYRNAELMLQELMAEDNVNTDDEF